MCRIQLNKIEHFSKLCLKGYHHIQSLHKIESPLALQQCLWPTWQGPCLLMWINSCFLMTPLWKRLLHCRLKDCWLDLTYVQLSLTVKRVTTACCALCPVCWWTRRLYDQIDIGSGVSYMWVGRSMGIVLFIVTAMCQEARQMVIKSFNPVVTPQWDESIALGALW